ncbi:DnaJ-domain-containing protein [Trametes gibbosa]|nr:DnaJ-domain-containing protein [Trametes gibbosa]
MFSYVWSSASTYFYLPIDEDADLPKEDSPAPPYRTKHLPWLSPEATDSDDSDDSSSAPSDSSTPNVSASSPPQTRSGPAPPPKRSKAVINEILAQNDCYAVLGISRSARTDRASLRRAYLARSKACHPDKFPDNPEATRAFQKVSVAYDILSKPSSKRLYDSRSQQAPFDFFATRSFPQAEETFRSVVIGVFNDLLDGDLEMVRTLLSAVNAMNPSLQLGEEGINSVLMTLQAIRARALTCRTCILALHHELTRLLEVQRAFRQLSYFDLRRRSHLSIRIARLTLGLPIALEDALQHERQQVNFDDDGGGAATAEDAARDAGGDGEVSEAKPAAKSSKTRRAQTALLNRQLYGLLRTIVAVLDRMERLVDK